jgi:hypothetical protein
MMRTISALLWRPALLLLLALVAIYFGLAYVTPYRDFSEAVIAVAAGLGAVGTVSYLVPALRVLFKPSWPERDEWATLALFLFLFTLAVTCAWALLWRLSGQPAFLVNNPVYDGRWLGFIVATVILIKAPNLFGRGVTNLNRATLGLAWLVTIAFVMFLWWSQPELHWLAIELQRYLDVGVGYGVDPP